MFNVPRDWRDSHPGSLILPLFLPCSLALCGAVVLAICKQPFHPLFYAFPLVCLGCA